MCVWAPTESRLPMERRTLPPSASMGRRRSTSWRSGSVRAQPSIELRRHRAWINLVVGEPRSLRFLVEDEQLRCVALFESRIVDSAYLYRGADNHAESRVGGFAEGAKLNSGQLHGFEGVVSLA